MTIKLGPNLISLRVQARLSEATGEVSSAFERLASGLRINKASDDAAGLAVAASLNSKTRILTQGIRNLNDGLSLLNTADSAIQSLTDILRRIEELAGQGVSGTYSATQRAAMQQEVTALQSEWNRVVEGTTFNGRQILTGVNTSVSLEGGESTLTVQIGKEALAGGFGDAAGATTRVSTSSSGVEGSGTSTVAAMSADGRYVAFYSDASNLVSGDTNGVQDAFIKDTVTGVTTRVSTDSSGVQGNGSSTVAAISADGRYVTFHSDASNLVSGDTNGVRDVFVKDTVTGVTTRVSTDSSGGESNGSSTVTAISADGRYVAYDSNASNLVAGDTNAFQDSFIKDTVTGITTRISTDSSGGQGNSQSSGPAISADGRYVAFRSHSTNLVAGDTNSWLDVFVKDTVTGVTTRVSTDSSGAQANGSSAIGGISADGRYILFFSSASDLVSGDTNASVDSFIKDTVTGVTTRVSTDSSGVQGDASSSATAISADGRYVLFSSSATNLVSGDTNLVQDAFIKDTISGVTTRVSIDNAGVQGDATSTAGVISADGRYVTFSSNATNLVSGDSNAASDVFMRDLAEMGIQTLSGMVVSNQVSAGVTMSLVQKYSNELMLHRSSIGASSNRIGYFVNTLASNRVNYAQAASRITDTDVAQDVAQLVAAQTRQRVASALLANANLEPQLVLVLLKNLR